LAHAHGHSHGASHAGHAHASGGDQRRLFWALLLTGGFMIVEVIGGVLSGSLALLADAAHMLTDTAALVLSWYAVRAARLPATPERSYGHARLEVLAALINSGALLGITAWITVEAVLRMMAPVDVLGGPMLAVAVAGLAVNVAALVVLHRGGSENLNVQGAALHVMSDLLGSIGAIVAAGVILLTGWMPIDPILSILVAVLILRSAWSLAARSWHVLMEGTPEDLDIPALRRELTAAVPGVADIHHVHAWSLTPQRRLLTLHATVGEGHDHDAVLRQLQALLAERYDLGHATIQVERGPCVGVAAGGHAPGGC
jgi:cobalt-zinc-cadmium efflux system protein